MKTEEKVIPFIRNFILKIEYFDIDTYHESSFVIIRNQNLNEITLETHQLKSEKNRIVTL